MWLFFLVVVCLFVCYLLLGLFESILTWYCVLFVYGVCLFVLLLICVVLFMENIGVCS